jgi:outer membrane protein, heavy metal efflux system
LRAAELGIEAASKRAGLQKAEVFAISGVVDANAEGKEGFEIGPGMQLPLPIFNRNQAGIARAKAEMERAAWNYLTVKARIRLEVREAFTRQLQANEDLRAWEKSILPPLEATVRQAQKAYELGNFSLLQVYENMRQLLTARARQAEIRADHRRALAELERSVGQRLDTLAPEP